MDAEAGRFHALHPADPLRKFRREQAVVCRLRRYTPIAPVHVGCDGRERAAKRCATKSNYVEQHGIGNSPAQPSGAIHRPRCYGHASGVEVQP